MLEFAPTNINEWLSKRSSVERENSEQRISFLLKNNIWRMHWYNQHLLWENQAVKSTNRISNQKLTSLFNFYTILFTTARWSLKNCTFCYDRKWKSVLRSLWYSHKELHDFWFNISNWIAGKNVCNRIMHWNYL